VPVDVLLRIKRLVARGRVRFTRKALIEMAADGLERGDVAEAILNARRVRKVIRSTSTARRIGREKLYVIESFSFTGTLIYTKGTIAARPEGEVFYVLISAKLSTRG
jgi:hypothetical protein